MSVDMESDRLPEDYLSPQSKIARMLAEVDDAPTPSPSPTARGTSKTLKPAQYPTIPSGQPQSLELGSSNVSSDDDASPTRPMGRAARRMMGLQSQSEHDDEDLYTATPAKVRYAASRPVSESPSVRSQRSTGLFVSPAKSSSQAGSDDDLPLNPLQSSRFADLIAAKRKERLDREKASRRARKAAKEQAASSDLPEEFVEMEDATDEPALEKILSDAARPTRKASKKAMLEMERETQRIAREQALAHQMKTKKKFSTSDLFARFNFRQPAQKHDSSSSVPNSDGLGSAEKQHREPLSTPPSSPPTPWDAQKALVEHGALARMVPVREDSIKTVTSMPADDDDDDDLPDINDILSRSRSAKQKQKQKQKQYQQLDPESPSRKAASKGLRNKFNALPLQAQDSDEELDIVQPMPAHLRAFDRVRPTDKKGETHSRAIHTLKHLAHLTHDDSAGRGKKLKAVVPRDVVNAGLLASAHERARQMQEQRMAELQAKGIIVMSVEEQEKEAVQIEDLIEQARREADDIRKKERAAARKAGNEDQLAASDDEDEEWEGSEEENIASDDEAEDVEDAENELIDVTADDDGVSQDDNSEEELPDTLPEPVTAVAPTPAKNLASQLGHRKMRVIEDDDDEEAVLPTPAPKATTQQDDDPFAVFGFSNDAQTPAQAQAHQDDPFAAFGFGTIAQGPALMSPTQAFAATMQTPTQNMISTFTSADQGYFGTGSARPPPPSFGQVQTQVAGESQSQLVPASQGQEHTQAIALDWETQLPETPMPEARTSHILVETPGWEPSPDKGLPSPWTAARRGLNKVTDEYDTQSTVRVRISQTPEVLAAKVKGRLTRGIRQASTPEVEAVGKVPKNAFSEMQRLRLENMNAADRAAAEKEMRDMMDEQAEESEDEYAGLGGDDSNHIAPETEEDRAMIDESNIEIDEDQAREMAKFYAERQRAAEEAATSKLFKDITTGALRRRQGVGWDLDEDEDEIAARRRQMRQREEARKRKLLLQDEHVKDLVDGKGDSKGREAFLKTIGDDDDFEVEEEELVEPPQEESQISAANQPLQEISHNKRKLDDVEDSSQPAKIRRTKETIPMSRPTSMLQVRESLSFLLDEPDRVLYGPSALDEPEVSDYESDHEVEEEVARDNDGGYAPDQAQEMPPPPLPTDRLPATQRRTPARPAVIDRLSLRRGSSSSSSSTGSAGWNAWSTTSGASKAPSLLRKATSNLSASNTNERGVSYGSDRRASAPSVVKIGGSKKSSLAYQSRAQERKAIVERAEKRKENERERIAEIRRQQGGALVGGFNSGQWE